MNTRFVRPFFVFKCEANKMLFETNSAIHVTGRTNQSVEPSERNSHRGTYSRVLVPLSLDRRELPAVQLGMQIANACDAKVTFLHVLSPTPVTSSVHWLDAIDNLWDAMSRPRGAGDGQDQGDVLTRRHHDICDFLSSEAKVDARESQNVLVQCRFGDVVSEIIRAADQGEADLVILCCELSTGWPAWLTPRVRQVLQTTRKQVVLVRPGR